MERTGREAVDLLFLQEVPLSEDWGAVCGDLGFNLFTDRNSNFQVRSLLLSRQSTVSAEPLHLPTADYHGSYLAAATISLPDVGETTAVSVHASPSVVEAKYRDVWQQAGRELPTPRPSAGPAELWDSDMVLATLALLAQEGPVLAAGDFNECLAWDDNHPGEWGREYFASVTRADLVSLTHRNEGVETQSAFTHDGLTYQLDHVLVTDTVADQIADAPRVDGDWSRESVTAGGLSDHAPLWFDLGRQ